jgi:hypothetical protein
MTLREKQSLFMKLLPRLLDYIHQQGYEVTGGELWRTPEQAAINAERGVGTSTSLHLDRLAIDLNLFKDGEFLTSTEALTRFGEYWESLHPLCCWGGRFSRPDGNHYSITHGGRK